MKKFFIEKDEIINKIKENLKYIKNNDDKFNMIINSKCLVFIFGIILLLKTILFYFQTIFAGNEVNANTIIRSIPFILVIMAPFFFMVNKKVRFYAVVISDFLISILLFADNLYYGYATNVISISQLSNAKYTKEILDTLPNILKIIQILYFIDIIFIIFMKIFKKIKLEKTKIRKRKLIFPIVFLLFVLYFTPSTIKNMIKVTSESPYNKYVQIRESTIYAYHIADIINNFNVKKTLKYKTYDELMNAYNELEEYNKENIQEDESFYNIAKNKNVIILQLESVQNFVVNRKINGTEITPNLNKFLKENIRFTNMTVQSFSTTADSEYSVITSLYPLENGEIFSKYYSSIHNDIFKNYKNAGYTVAYMHGNEGTFWNREAVYSRLDIDDLVFLDDFQDKSELVCEYLSDELLYTQAVEKMKQYNNPFVVNLVAASSHTPYELEGLTNREEKITVDVGKYKGISFGNYLEAVNYADYAFGKFIEQLKEANLYDDTVILVFGDHYGMSMIDEDVTTFIKEIDPQYNDIKQQINFTNVLCGIKIPGAKKQVIKSPVSKIDIKPTLMKICGIEDSFSLGNSMFSNNDYVCINNERILTSKYYYNGDWYVIETGQLLDLETLNEDERKMLQTYEKNMRIKLDISKASVINNLLKK